MFFLMTLPGRPDTDARYFMAEFVKSEIPFNHFNINQILKCFVLRKICCRFLLEELVAKIFREMFDVMLSFEHLCQTCGT